MNLSVCTTAKTGVLLALTSLSLTALAGSDTQGKGMDYLRTMRESGFTENRGQWDSRALFLATSKGKNVWVTKDGFVVDLFRMEKVKGAEPGKNDLRRVGHVLKFQLEGANSSAVVQGSSRIPRRIDYMSGGEQGRVVSTTQYKEAYVNNVYQGVDLRSYLDGGNYRYDLIAKPGADAGKIRFRISGADRVRVDEKGTLLVTTSFGELKQTRPVVYQQVGAQRSNIEAGFVVNGSTVSFKLGKYNPNLPVVIDPLVYGSYVGADFRVARADQLLGDGNSDDVTYAATADSNGNLYMTGYTTSDNFPIQNGPYGFDYNGFRDAYLIRMAADAYALDYAAFIGGTGRDEGRAIGLAQTPGVIWLGGVTTSTDFPGAVNTAAFTASGFPNAFWFMKVDLAADGTITPILSRYYIAAGNASFADKRTDFLLGTNFVGANAYFGGMAVASNGNMFFGGDANNLNTTFSAFLSGATKGGRDGFVQRFLADGTESSRRFVGSRFTDTMGRIDVTPDNGVVLTGGIQSNINQDTANPGAQALIFPTTPGVFSGGRLIRNNDAYVVKLNSVLTPVWSAVLGGASNDRGVAIASDPKGDVYILTKAGSFDFPRTRGVYDAVNENVEDVATKISANGSTMVYSTGLRHRETVNGVTIKADARGVAVVGGTVGFRYPGGTPPQPMIEGSIPTTPDARDSDYSGGDNSVFPDNTLAPTDLTGFRASYEGFVQFINSTGTDVIYASYIGGDGDEQIHDVHIDRVGASWLLGETNPVFNRSGGIKGVAGLPGHITTNAFKVVPDTAGEALDGFAIKLRVQLPILNGLSTAQTAIAGGLGASTTGTVTLSLPAQAGGVVINLELSNPAATSFDAAGGQSRRSVVIPAGATAATFDVFTKPVTVPTPSTLRATLDNDFLVTEISVNPWLSELTTTPGTLIGGNQLNLIVRLFQNATQEIRIPITTSNNVLVVPPVNNEIVVPAGAASASILLDTGGVEAQTIVDLSGSLLGVTKLGSVTLNRAELTSVSFSPDRILSDETTTMTVTYNGKVGAARTINLTRTAGVASTVNGLALPTSITIGAQGSAVTAQVKAPRVTATSFTTIAASSGAFSAGGTFFIDPIDILSISVTPGTDALGGALLKGRVTLTRPAGQSDFPVTLSNSNSTAGTLGVTNITIPAGQVQSAEFDFQTNIVGSLTSTILRAARTGYTTRSVTVTVRPIKVLVDVTPNSVLGGDETANVAVSLDTPAPIGGLVVNLSSSIADAILSTNSVDIPAGATAPVAGTVITVTTNRVATDRTAVIRGQLSNLSSGTDNLVIRAPRVTRVTINPTAVAGGTSSVGTVTVEATAPAGGMRIALASNNTVATVPVAVTIPEGETTANFAITTRAVDQNTTVTVTATGSSSNASATLTVVATSIQTVLFTPTIVKGGLNATGRITLNNNAPAGGLVIGITSDLPGSARPTVTQVTVPAGQRTVNFTVTTVRTSRRINVGFTATMVSTGRTGRGFLGISP